VTDLLLPYTEYVLCCFFSGLVPLHNACSYGHYEVTELLVKHGASVNVADLWKFTPLHEAAAKGKYEIVRLLLKVCHKIMCVSCDNMFFFFLNSWLSSSNYDRA